MLKAGFLLVAVILSGFVFIGYNFVEAQQTVTFPSWLKNTSQWWREGQISDDEFLNTIKYLIDNKIISNTASEVLH
jgi:hypothetical protein